MTVSEYIWDFLANKGNKNVFMVSGSSAMWLCDALYKEKRLKQIPVHHEQVASMAADAVGRYTNEIGACLVTIGPGATNAITGVAGAYVDSSPMIVVSGQASSKLLQYEIDTKIRQHGTQSLNLEPMVSSITNYFAAVMNENDIRYHIEKAYYYATTGRPGPVWLDIPIDIQNKQVKPHDEMESFTAPTINENESFDVNKIKELLLNSKKPLILAGGGIGMANCRKEFREFVNKYKIPVVTSRGGIDCISSDCDYFIGRPGAYGDRASHFAIQNCDLLLTLGSRFSVSTIGYYPKDFAKEATIIQVDIDQKELDKDDVPVDILIKSDLKNFIKEISNSLGNENINKTDWNDYCKNLKQKYPVVLDEYEQESPINSYYFVDMLSKKISDNTSIVVDTGSVCNVVSQSFNIKENQRYIISAGLSCMGFWASAVGTASLGVETIALAGDGSTQMNIQEFATMKHHNLPIKLFIFKNNGYCLIRHNQHNYLDDRFIGVGADSGVEIPDFCKIATAYGLPSVDISKSDDISAKIDEVLNTKGPIICQINTQELQPLVPRIASRVMEDGSLKAAAFDDLFPFIDVDEKF